MIVRQENAERRKEMFELKIRIFTDLGEDAIDAFREVVPEEGVEFSVEYWDEDPVRISDALPVFISSNRYLLEKAERLDYLIVGVGITLKGKGRKEETLKEDILYSAVIWPQLDSVVDLKTYFQALLHVLKAEQETMRYFGKVPEGYGIPQSIATARSFEKDIMRIAMTDDLTGLYNRRYFLNYLHEKSALMWTLLYMDLDNFHNVNDVFGHSRGDEILKRVASILDQIFPYGINIRLGGDEFAVLLEEEYHSDLLNDKIAQLEGEVQTLIPERPELLTISVGIVSRRGEIKDVDEFLREGDMRMYEVKRVHHEKKKAALQLDREPEDVRKILNVFREAFIKMDEDPAVRRSGHILARDYTPQLKELAEYLRVGRIGVQYFDSQEKEHYGEGSSFDIYNCGSTDETRYIERRYVTGGFNIAYYRAVIREGEPDWQTLERDRVDLLLRMCFVFNGRKRLQEIAERLSFYDQDMGIRNVKYYFGVLGRLAHERKLSDYTAMRINMRRFTAVNQQIGHKLGDLVMKRFVDEIASQLSGDEMICRLGGDNFVLLVDKDHEDDILDMLEESIIVYNDETGDRIRVGASVGVYQIPDDGSLHLRGEIMDRVTRAASRAKASKDTAIVYFDAAMVKSTEREMEVETSFHDALENEEFRVFYQPKVDMRTYKLVGAEALCRWFKGTGMIPPGDFIPHLEQSMDICALDMYMLDHVCRDIRRWLDEGREVPRVSVNLSRRNLADVDILRHILEVIDRNQVPHEYVEIELTETTTDSHFVDLRRIVSGLQESGVKTAVDDFGIGFSSLTLIRDLPWDVLKIDRSFLPVEGEPEEQKKNIMFRTVVSMAQGLGMESIVEGVETKAQLKLMQESHCDQAQGFFFDRPMPREEFEKRMEDSHYRELAES